MKSQKMKISTLVGAMALAGAVTLPTMAMAEVGDTSFSIFLRAQAEVVSADSYGDDGLTYGDGWRFGQSDSGGWGGLFFNMSHQITENTKAVGRYSRNLNTGGLTGDRDIWIGVDSKTAGRLTFGRHNSVYKLSTLGWDPFNATFLQARGNQGRDGRTFGAGGFIDDSIDYSISFSGIKLDAMVGIEDPDIAGSSADDGDHLMSFAISAPVGPVELLAAYIDASNYGTRGDDATATKLGARFNSGPLTLSVEHEMRDEGMFAGGEGYGDYTYASGSYKMGKWRHSLNVGQFSDDSGADNDGSYLAIGSRYTWTRIVALTFGYRRTERDVTGDDNVFGLGLRVGLNTGNLLAR